MWLKIIFLLYCATAIKAQSTETNLDKSSILCFNDTDCELSESTNDTTQETTPIPKTVETVFIKNEGETELPKRATPSNPVTPATSLAISKPQSQNGICDCDLTISSCDVNCCCDTDCNELDMQVFSACKDNHPKLYDTRYCYDNNYIQYNHTRYLLEKLSDNLFCIVYDNLPPVYSTDYEPIISKKSSLDEIVSNSKKSRFNWDHKVTYTPSIQFDSDKPYRNGDIIWKMQNSFIKTLELPQSGFTGICTFKKALRYLEDSKHSCMQISLENTNTQLFAKAYNNFTIIASPVLYGNSNFTTNNKSCPREICVPVQPHYCLGLLSSCENTSLPIGKCNNGICNNIVKKVRYVISHTGIKGIDSIDVYLEFANASQNFYQYFDVEYKWLRDDQSEVFHLSGNPGYNLGKPIIIGSLITNKTNAGDYSYVQVNRNEHHLSLPLGKKGGQCHNHDRYVVNFGENLKLNCRMELQTRNFTVNSCVDLQMEVIDILLKGIGSKVTEIEHGIHVAKWNYHYYNSTDDWVKILLDRIPQNVVTGQIIDDQLMCSGLVTALRIDVVYRHLPDPKTVDNYKILGVAITFSEDSDIYWDKCETENCIDTLAVNVVSYVMFHDVSQPSKYFFAEGPNLDISLPHDFFYPFINDASNNNESHLIVLCTSVAMLIVRIIL
ncbi:tectonic-1 [Athalia rosae]|uniref:tectonic-1 n=1 Tax=Athalia rosae TaxID=37344 RepID=UPI0020336088|nr:tectonic-1 [Athalia rosae]